MIYDELTARDWYMYRRGEMREYIRNQGKIDPNSRSRLYQWVDTGHSVHDNPWGIRDPLCVRIVVSEANQFLW